MKKQLTQRRWCGSDPQLSAEFAPTPIGIPSTSLGVSLGVVSSIVVGAAGLDAVAGVGIAVGAAVMDAVAGVGIAVGAAGLDTVAGVGIAVEAAVMDAVAGVGIAVGAAGLDTVAGVEDAWAEVAGRDDTDAKAVGIVAVISNSLCVERCNGSGNPLDAGERLGSGSSDMVIGGILKVVVVQEADLARESSFKLITCAPGGSVVVLVLVLFRLELPLVLSLSLILCFEGRLPGIKEH